MTMRGLCLTLMLLAVPAVVAAQGDGAIVVTKDVAAGPPTSQAVWKVTLPPGHLTDQAWLVVDGKSQGLAGYDIDPNYHSASIRLYVDINSGIDGQVKQILQAQGLPVKENVSVYQVAYGVNRSGEYTAPLTLRFRHSADGIAYRYDTLPETARYKIGDRITVFDAVMFDSSTGNVFDSSGLRRLRPGLSPLTVHHVLIQVQILRVGADGKVIQQPETP